MSPTTLLYLEDMHRLEAETTVADVINEDGADIVILNETIFYPQGGGQPYDQGRIESSSNKFNVTEVRFVEGIVKHIGTFESGSLAKGDAVTCHVDAERRALHARLHSAGHVVDMAVSALSLPWTPGKGYHFPDGPYVEYTGTLEGVDAEKLKSDIESHCNAFIKEGRETAIRFATRDEMKTLCRWVPDYIPENKPGRVVLYGDFGVPCGGTHVANLRDIGQMTIRNVKKSGGNVRVGYSVSL